ncbi:MAG: peptidase [Xanthobacteraceae bacterium]|jgi:predicted Zn-dependent protease|nr:peptidase [Xanthobacteraceae bacterium]
MTTSVTSSKARHRPPESRRSFARRALTLLSVAALLVQNAPAQAQGKLPVIRDAEIEQLMRDYTRPILKVANLAQQNIQVVLINDRSFNAFVADGRRIFVNTGALVDSKAPNEIIGVLAHETGHIAGGHLSRMREQLAKAQTQMIIAMLLGAAAMGAAIASKSDSAGGIGAAALSAPQAAIQRSLLSYQRAHEEQADRAAVKFLAATGQSPKGMYETFKRLADQLLFMSKYVDPYMQSHPMPSERVEALGVLAKSSPYWDQKDPPELQLRHDLARAKLAGFMEGADTVQRRYPAGDASLPARYARAISAYRFGDLRTAIAQIDALIQAQPGNPYFHEVKGQALLEGGRANEAITPLRQAVKLSNNAPLIEILLAQAMVGSGNAAYAEEAVTMLSAAVIREPDSPEAYSYLARAYGKKGDLAQADLASAQASLARGDIKTARELAARARIRFPLGSPGWVKSEDIVGIKLPETTFQRR